MEFGLLSEKIIISVSSSHINDRREHWHMTSDMIGEAGAKEGKADCQYKKVVALHFIRSIPITS